MARTFFLLAIAASLVVLAGIFWVIFTHYPDNHIGFDPLRLTIPLIAIVITVAIGLARSTKNLRLGYLAFVVALAVLATVLVFDRCNFLVHYESWLKRGMPEFGECGI